MVPVRHGTARRTRRLARKYGKMGSVKTTVEMPDPLFRQVKAAAAERGVSLKEFFAEAVRDRLRRRRGSAPEKPWMSVFGGLRQLHRETRRVDRLIAEEFEQIDEEDRR